MFGIEFLAAKVPPLNSQILLVGDASYVYNRLPADVEARANKWKLVTTDLKAHAARQVRLVFNFALMYVNAYDRQTVNNNLDRTLADWVGGLGFRQTIQVSDILQVAHNVAGVDNIRFLNSTETASLDVNDYGIQQVSANGTYLSHYETTAAVRRPVDIILSENQVPVLYGSRYAPKAQNSYGEPA